MLEKTLLRYTESGLRSFDKGSLAEATLFFEKVTVSVGYPDFENFLKLIGYDDLLHLVSKNIIKLVLDLDTPICASYKNSAGQYESDFDFFHHFPSENPKTIIEKSLIKTYGSSRKFSNIIDHIVTTRFNDIIYGEPINFINSLKQKIVYNGFGTSICQKVTKYLNPPVDLPELFHYRFETGEYGLIGTSPIKENISLSIPSRTSYNEPFKFLPGSFLTLILDTAYYIEMCSKYNSGLRGTPLGSICATEFYLDSFEKVQKNVRDLDLFVETAIEGFPSLKERINLGDKTFDDILPIIEKKKRFSAWARNISDDSNLVQEYISNLRTGTWLDKLPTRIGRFLLFSGAGLAIEPFTAMMGIPGASSIGGFTLGAIDSFLINQVASGWSPTIYIDEVKRLI